MRAGSLSSGESEDTRLAHVSESLRTGLWFVPILFVLGAVALSMVTVAVDRRFDEPVWLAFAGGPISAQQILTTIATSMMTFTGLVFTITIVALQLASSQFSPRVMRFFLRDRGSQVALGVFTATFVFALVILVQIRTGVVGDVFVAGLSVSVAFALVIVSLITFVYFVNHIAQMIRVVNIIEAVAEETRAAIDVVFPADVDTRAHGSSFQPTSEPRQLIAMGGHGGVIAGLDTAELVDIARRHHSVVVLVRDMGDYVAEGAALFEVHGGTESLPRRDVLRQLDIARERNMRQDPAFGFRQLVDIAVKALSPAINDPTTAIQVLDRLHDLLRRVATRPQPSGIYLDADGEVRFVRAIISWAGFVTLAFEEIREYGGASVQIHRRMRASLEELLDVVPLERREPLLRQLRLELRSAARFFPAAEERELAEEADESGLGSEREDELDEADAIGERARPFPRTPP